MKTKLPLLIGVLLIIGFCIPGVAAVADPFKINGEHYNLNIVGVKDSDQIKVVGDSMGHTMFVKLNGRTKIIMTQDDGGVFQVVDRSGLDGTAEFNIAPGYYNVYAKALGKPDANGKLQIDAWGNFEDAQTGEREIWLGAVNLARTTGKPQSVNINNLFYVDVTVCTAWDEETLTCTEWTTYTDTWVFDIDELIEYWWDYQNDGVKLLQVRFYPCTLLEEGDSLTSDYCRWANGDPIYSLKTVVA